jgi:hypothetical protein
MDDDESKITEKYEALRGVMDEQMRRLWAATEARALGYGGVSTVARAVGLTRPTITAGRERSIWWGECDQITTRPHLRPHQIKRSLAEPSLIAPKTNGPLQPLERDPGPRLRAAALAASTW